MHLMRAPVEERAAISPGPRASRASHHRGARGGRQMKLCVGTAKGIVILDAERRGTPLLALADPSSVWCMAQDCRDPGVIYAGAVDHAHMGAARGKGTLARSVDGGRTWADITPGLARTEDVWAVATAPDAPGELFIGTSHARLLHSRDHGRSFRECSSFLKLPGRDRWSFPPPPHIPHVRAIEFDPREPATIYIGIEEGGVARPRREVRAAQQCDLRGRALPGGRSAESAPALRDHRQRLLPLGKPRRLMASEQTRADPHVHGAAVRRTGRAPGNLHCGGSGTTAVLVGRTGWRRRADFSQRRLWDELRAAGRGGSDHAGALDGDAVS